MPYERYKLKNIISGSKTSSEKFFEYTRCCTGKRKGECGTSSSTLYEPTRGKVIPFGMKRAGSTPVRTLGAVLGKSQEAIWISHSEADNSDGCEFPPPALPCSESVGWVPYHGWALLAHRANFQGMLVDLLMKADPISLRQQGLGKSNSVLRGPRQ